MMIYFLLIGIAVVTFALAFYNQKRIRQKRILQLQHLWVHGKTGHFDFPGITQYAAVSKEKPFHRLAEQTIDDIDLYSLFKCIDRTASKVGQQYLYKTIIEPSNKTHFDAEALVQLFSANGQLRTAVQLELLKLNRQEAYHIATLLEDRLLQKPRWYNLLMVDVSIVVLLLLLSVKYPVALLFLLIPFSLNMFLHLWNKNNTLHFSASIPQLNLLIQVCRTLLKKDPLLFDEEAVKSIADLSSFRKKSSLINFKLNTGIEGDLSQVVFYVFELIKAVFLIEIFTLFRVLKELEDKQAAIAALFRYAGNIDVSISVAAIRHSEYKTCQPVFTAPKKELIIKGAYHPLIENCVTNDLSIVRKSILITGSNMAGKSTFLRTVMINSILAQTIHTCFADEFTTPVVKQFSSIKINDSLLDGKSYYFQEVDIMGALIEEAGTPFQHLFILDEVFKGTNTIERIAAGKAILSYLNRDHNMVLVSSHDIELVDMLADEYDLYHFTETVEGNELYFDHRIKAGPLKTRNAIRLLELSDYPADIVAEANRISATLSSRLFHDKG